MTVNKSLKRIFSLSGLALAVAGCSTTGDNMGTPHFEEARESIKEIEALQREQAARNSNKVEVLDSFYADRGTYERGKDEFLTKVAFSMDVAAGQALSLTQIMQVFARNGVNITNALDVTGYYYTGPSVAGTDARSALRIILGNMGLDYTVDEETKVVTINSMPRKSYYLSLNNRSSTYTSGAPGGLSGEEGEAESAAEPTELGITANNDFWNSLEEELGSRCGILLPSYGEPTFSAGPSAEGTPDDMLVDSLQSGAAGVIEPGAQEETEERLVCLTSVNRNTGTVTVHGPRWVQEDMEAYFDRLNTTLNTRITIDAKIVLFATNEEESRGVDLSAFIGSLEETGLAVSNNVLGGITLGASGNMAVVSDTDSVARSFIGARIDGAQAFIGWLESHGSVSIENEPSIATVSGVPTTFKRTSPVVYFRYNQESTAIEGGGTSVSISTEEVERSVGSIINVNPTYDMDRGVVRAQLSIDQRYLTGYEEDVNILAAGNDIVEVPVRVPLIESIVLNGEILLRDGETIIVGGQKFTTAENDASGVSKLRDNSVFGGLFGRSRASNEVMTYYTIMTVRVDESPNNRVVRM